MTDEPSPPPLNIMMPPDMMGGVWANFAGVNHSKHEFTLDFCRVDYRGDVPVQGVVVARVNMSPLFMSQLMEVMQLQWQLYVDQAMPKEVHGGEEPEA
jgi:hypothetical protein